MTACVKQNKKAKGGALSSRVLRSVLAAVLAIGLMPTVAFADDGISTMDVAGAPQRFSQGEIVLIEDANGYTVEADADGVYPLQAGEGYASIQVLPMDEQEPVEADIMYANSQIKGSAAASSYTYVATAPTAAGTYYAKAVGKAGSEYATGTLYFKVAVPQKSLDGVFAYEYDSANPDSLADRTFNFNFADQKGDVKWAMGSEDITSSVTVAWYKDGKAYSGQVRDAGTYVAQVKGNGGTDYAGAVAYVEVVMNKLNVATVSFSSDDKAWTGSPIAVSNPTTSEKEYTALNGNGIIKWTVSGPTTSGLVIDKGEYTWTGTLNTDDDAVMQNLEGTATASFQVRGTVVSAASFKYDGQQIGSAVMSESAPLAFDKSDADKDKQAFDAEKVTVVDDGGDEYEQGTDYTISFEKKNADGTWSATSDVTATGTYRMTVAMNGAKDLAGKAVGYFTVTNGAIAGTNMFVTFEGEPAGNTITTTYDGENVIDDIAVTVKKGSTTLVEDVDYTVEFTKGGKVVDEIVDAATDYKMTITPVTYTGTAETVAITVNPVEAYSFRVVTGKFNGLLYTGKEIVPTIEYQTAENPFSVYEDGELVVNPKYESEILPADVYAVKNLKYLADGAEKAVSVDAIQEPGAYTFDVALYGDAKNYKMDGGGFTSVTVVVLDKLNGFEDVSSTDWFVGPVNAAHNAGWMNGLGDTALFAPASNMTRADVACVLYNMAGGSAGYLAQSSYPDVPGEVYFTWPVEWAKMAGVVNGYPDGTFSPYKSITREEFASMLANYAKAYGVYEAPASDALDGVAGAEGVSEYAVANVAWAVENGIMGNNGANLNAQGTITRAEVAAMIVNYGEAFGLIK